MPQKSEFEVTAEGILQKVVERLQEGQRLHGDEYFLSDVPNEFDDEVHDIIGWMMLHAIRLKMVSMGVVRELNDEYLGVFVKKTRTQYLELLRTFITKELQDRQDVITNEENK